MSELLQIRHESGDFSEYDTDNDPLNLTSVSVAARLAGSFWGMQVEQDLTADSGMWVKNFTVAPDAPGLALRFYFDPNGSGNFNAGRYLTMVRLFAGGDLLTEIWLKQTVDVDCAVNRDGGSSVSFAQSDANNPGTNIVELHIVRATTDSSEDGVARWWVNADARVDPPTYETPATQDFYDRVLGCDSIHVGRESGSDQNSTPIFIDEIVLRDDLEPIGPHVEETDDLPALSDGKVQSRPTIFLQLAKSVDSTGLQEEVDVTGLDQISGVVQFTGADVANDVAIETKVSGVWGEAARITPGGTEVSGSFDIHGRFDSVRANVIGLGAGVNVTSFGNGTIG